MEREIMIKAPKDSTKYLTGLLTAFRYLTDLMGDCVIDNFN